MASILDASKRQFSPQSNRRANESRPMGDRHACRHRGSNGNAETRKYRAAGSSGDKAERIRRQQLDAILRLIRSRSGRKSTVANRRC